MIDLFRDDRVMVRLEVDDRNQVVDFSMTQQTLDDGEWMDVCRVDCDHDEVHVHWYDQSGRQVERKVIHPIASVDDVRCGWDYAADLIYERWEQNRRRWSGGR